MRSKMRGHDVRNRKVEKRCGTNIFSGEDAVCRATRVLGQPTATHGRASPSREGKSKDALITLHPPLAWEGGPRRRWDPLGGSNWASTLRGWERERVRPRLVADSTDNQVGKQKMVIR